MSADLTMPPVPPPALGGPARRVEPTAWASPLQVIEDAVRARAKVDALDAAGSDGRARIARLVDDEIRRWADDHKRGLRAAPLADPARVADRAVRNLAGYGPLEPLLDDPSVWEIIINGPTEIFVRRHIGHSGFHDEVFHDDDHVIRTITKLLDDSATSHRKLDPSEGLQDAQLDDGSRVHLVHRDIGRDGHLLVNIRRFSGVRVHSLDELVGLGSLDHDAAAFLRACVRARLSVIFAGPPGSGKTTLLSCCTAELDPSLRVVTAEEVFELDIQVPNHAGLQTRPARADRPEVDLRRLVAGFLRMAPDIAIVGEVRDREALPLLLTLSSGVKGFTTIHAGSARQALSRLRFICQLSDAASELPMSALTSLVTEAVDVVVHCARRNGQPQVTEILCVEDLQSGRDGAAFTTTDVFRRHGPTGALRWTGDLPVRAGRAIEDVGIDLRRLLGADRAPVSEPT